MALLPEGLRHFPTGGKLFLPSWETTEGDPVCTLEICGEAIQEKATELSKITFFFSLQRLKDETQQEFDLGKAC